MVDQIEVEKDFVVSYNCHTDEYLVKGSDTKVVKGWKAYAQSTHIVREIVSENKAAGKVSWGLRKSQKREDYTDDKELRELQPKIRWTLKVSGGASIFIFVNSVNNRYSQVKWNVIIDEKQIMSQLSPLLINKVQCEKGSDCFSGMGILSRGLVQKPALLNS